MQRGNRARVHCIYNQTDMSARTGVAMSNQLSSRYQAPTSFHSSNSALLDGPYQRHGNAAAVHPPLRMTREPEVFAPIQIWGQYNNYRSNGVVGSAVVHIIFL